jgi:hypothetical protein
MGVMAVGAEKVGSFATHKVSYPFPMDSCLPIPVDVSVTFAAEPVTLCKMDEFPVIKPEFIPILSVVAVQTPSHGLGVMELDCCVFVFKVPLFPIDFHGGVTVTARKHSLRKGRRGNRELFCCHGRGDKKHCRHNRDHHSETY